MGRDKHKKILSSNEDFFSIDKLTTQEHDEYQKVGKSMKVRWESDFMIRRQWSMTSYSNDLRMIYSFGMDNGAIPSGTQKAFDCRRLNLRGHGLDLRFGRGNDDEFQKEAESDEEFKHFICLVAKCIMDNKYHTIAFYCSKGHHRSVAAAELFRRIFAPQCEIIHTCLKK